MNGYYGQIDQETGLYPEEIEYYKSQNKTNLTEYIIPILNCKEVVNHNHTIYIYTCGPFNSPNARCYDKSVNKNLSCIVGGLLALCLFVLFAFIPMALILLIIFLFINIYDCIKYYRQRWKKIENDVMIEEHMV